MTNDSTGPEGPAPDSPREFEDTPPPATPPPPPATPPPPPAGPPPPPSTPPAETSEPATPGPEVAAPAPPPPSPSDGPSPLLGFAKRFGVPLLVIVIALGAFLWSSLGDADDDGNVAEDRDLAAGELAVGDCLKQPESGEVIDVTAIPCATKHDSEVYATFDLKNAADAYPGEKKLFRVAGVGCAKRFEKYMGIPARRSRLGRLELVPDETAWDDGDRGVTCLASMPGGKQTIGSLKGKRK